MGGNGFGQLGNGASGSGADRNKPVGVGGGHSAPDIKALAGGANHSLALKTDGTVWAWGYNGGGELGSGTTGGGTCFCSSTPVQVRDEAGTGFLTGITAIDAGADHSLALKTDGTVRSWGANDGGQLGNGDGTLSERNVPVKVINLSGVTGISASGHHSLAK